MPCPCAQCEAMAPPAVTGEIRSTRRLEVIRAHLLIRAYNVLHPDDHATATVNVTVQGTDHQAPRCVPAIFVYGSGGSGVHGALCCTQDMRQAELLAALPQVPGARNNVPWQHLGDTEVHRLHQH